MDPNPNTPVRRRPAPVSVLACIFFVLAALALAGVAQFGWKLASDRDLSESPAHARVLRAFCANLAAVPVLIALGMGLWRMREWARKGSIAFCVIGFAWIMWGYYTIAFGSRAEVTQEEWIGLAIGLALFLFLLGFPVALLVWPSVRAAFQGLAPDNPVDSSDEG